MQLEHVAVLVMGLGVHGGGLGVARWLVRQGARVTVTDLRGPEALAPALAQLAGLPVRLVLGEHRAEDFQSHALVVANPAVRRDSPWLQLARVAGAQVESEMTLFFRRCPAPILAITGSKGKTTTTLLTTAMLREQFPGTVVAGNLRVSALEQLESITPATPVVLELSSFQLETLDEARLSPPFAAVTTIVPDHLDRYGSMEAYVAAKRAIYAHQDARGVVVLNADNAWLASSRPPGQLIWFGEDRTGDGVSYDDAGVWWCERGRARVLLAATDDIKLTGRHNRANVAAAAALAYRFGVAPEGIRRAVAGFHGVEHRLELVRELDGVRYINDTAATAPDAAIAALHSFDAPAILIAGGASKQLPLAGLAHAAACRARVIVLLAGSATPELEQLLRAELDTLAPDQRAALLGPFDDFEAAIYAARAVAAAGEVVLLSPGCASFGMFRNEFHRGEDGSGGAAPGNGCRAGGLCGDGSGESMASPENEHGQLDPEVERWMREMEREVGPDRRPRPNAPPPRPRARDRFAGVRPPGGMRPLAPEEPPPPTRPAPRVARGGPVQVIQATRVLLGLNVAMYLLTALLSADLVVPQLGVLLGLGAKANDLIVAGQYWRLLTPVILHGSLLHLVFNSLALWTIGPPVEQVFGTRRFLAIYLLAGIAGSLASFVFNPGVSVGASGAIFGLVGALIVFFYTARRIYGVMSQQQLGSLFFMLAINLGIGFSSPQIDNAAHLGGLAGGLLAAWALVPRYRVEAQPGYAPIMLRTDRPERVWPRVALVALGLAMIAAAAIRNW